MRTANAAERPQRGHEINRFKNVRLALRVVAEQQVEAGRKIRIQPRVIAEVAKSQMDQMHSENIGARTARPRVFSPFSQPCIRSFNYSVSVFLWTNRLLIDDSCGRRIQRSKQFMKIASYSSYCLRWLMWFPFNMLILRIPVNLCRAAFYAIAPFVWPSEIKRGIRILDFHSKTRPEFVKAIDAALTLLEQNDVRRFERVKREIRLIVYDRHVLAPGAYFRQARLCMIDLARNVSFRTPRFRVAVLAALIVHEATHGHLCRKRILHARRIRRRTEAVCVKEETRFLFKAGFDLREFFLSEENMKNPQYMERLTAALDKMGV